MNEPRLSVTVITLNEENNIGKCLDSVEKIADEIVVVDSGSCDDTVRIAKKYGAKVYFREFDNYSSQKNYAAEKAKGNWILSLDADEIVTPGLFDEIKKAIKKDNTDAYLIPRRNIIFGKEIQHTRWSPDEHVWLWRKEKGSWQGSVHEEVTAEGNIGRLRRPKIHYQYKTVSEFLNMINCYTDFEAEQKYKEGKRFSYLKLFSIPLRSFMGRFIYKKGFLDGWRGFVLSYLMAIYRFTTWVKVWEEEKVN